LRFSLVLLLVLAWAVRAEAAGIHVALTPSVVTVDPDSDFTLELTVTAADASFNGFDSVVEFDPAVLTFLPSAPSALQEGDLMTGACGNTFHRCLAAGDSLVISDVLLCAGQTLTGPGQIYRLKFHAGPDANTTFVRLRPPRTRFYNAGLYVLPVETADAEVRIGSAVGVEPPPAASGLSLRAFPNPARAGVTLRITNDQSGRQSVAIYDARGRAVQAFPPADASRGARSLFWDGRDRSGRRVAPGKYLVVVQQGARRISERLTLLD
jgi:hypothetical protein